MNDTMVACLERRTFDAAALLDAHPPRLKNAHKVAIQALVAASAPARGTIGYSRWTAERIPEVLAAHRAEVEAVPDVFDYATGEEGVWHVNFADPRLFVAYGSGLLAQDELQVLEHPALGSVREALLAESVPAVTEEAGRATPVLITGVERRVSLDTSPDPARPLGLYGNRFQLASFESVRAALVVLDPPTRTNLIAMAAPVGSGAYRQAELAQIVHTAWTAFAAAVGESRRLWPAAAIEVHTGFWGCGAFGGNRVLMTVLQIVAAHLAGLDRLVFHTFDRGGLIEFDVATDCLRSLLAGGGSIAAILDRLLALGFRWGVSDGN